MEERLTKKERKELRKLEERQHMQQNTGSKSKIIVISILSILFLAFFTFAIIVSKQKANAPVKLSNAGWLTGNPTSKVTLTEFGDFQCPACKAFEPIMQKMRAEYGRKVKIVFKHFPLKSAHPNALIAAKASEAAGAQGKFWEFHDILYENQDLWVQETDPTGKFIEYAKKLQLDVEKFKLDLKNKSFEDKINAQQDEGIQVGVQGTPSVYVNGTSLGVPSGFDQLKKEIEKALK